MSVSSRSTKAATYSEIEKLRLLCDRQQHQINALHERIVELSMPRDSARSFMIPKDVAKAYFAVNPNAKSVTRDDLVAWMQANLAH